MGNLRIATLVLFSLVSGAIADTITAEFDQACWPKPKKSKSRDLTAIVEVIPITCETSQCSSFSTSFLLNNKQVRHQVAVSDIEKATSSTIDNAILIVDICNDSNKNGACEEASKKRLVKLHGKYVKAMAGPDFIGFFLRHQKGAHDCGAL
jgi:hypothetical protein